MTTECTIIGLIPPRSWWLRDDNHYINSNGGNMAVIVCFGPENTFVDNQLYQNHSTYRRIINLSKDYISYEACYDSPVMVPIDFTTNIKQFVVVKKAEDYNISYTSFATSGEAIDYVSSITKDDCDCAIIIDLGKMDVTGSANCECMVGHIVYYVSDTYIHNTDYKQ